MEHTKKIKRKHMRVGRADRILYTTVGILMTFLLVVVLYPMIYVVSSSFSSGAAITGGRVLLFPVDFSLDGYRIVFSHKRVWSGYYNTLIYSIGGTAINLVLTTMAAYPLSRRDYQGKKVVTLLFMVTMFISGGMVPSYILMSNLHLLNTRWSILLSGAISTTNMILMRTFFRHSIPDELLDAARMDGVSDIGYLLKIVLPLSKAVFAVITLYYLVGHWNSYFTALLYLRDNSLQPLQLVMREILNASTVSAAEIADAELAAQAVAMSDLMKYGLIVVSTVPVLVLYPFVQKFFEKGVMIGSLKG